MRKSLLQIYDARVATGLLKADAAQRALLPRFDDIIEALETPVKKPGLFGLFAKPPEAVRGLYLWGGVGRGKSMLMDLFHEAVSVPKRRVHFHAFMQEVQAKIEAARRAKEEDALLPAAKEIAASVRLLCFDEMQITDIADAMIVGRLFEELFKRGVTIVTTSNRPPEDLYKNGLNRQLFVPFIAILRAQLDVVEIASETDYRQHRLTGAQVYFSPASKSAHAAMDALWDELTGHDAATKLELEVKGRKVVVPHFHNGVGRASFWELCGAMLGPGDYLAIAAAVKVLMIDDIPQLSASNFNEAKRFVTLIDTLYEAKVRLICSAAEVPERLYNEGTGSFEFERTASRLREMQSADWGANRA
ncbi:cell division protein ZapE [Rhodobacter aestuarii]|uniref:Cell division protein ZapE n=1 Tax=Rhodobacter aestuarii TaxID=453582 RepID=A0A1N7PT92_9RHOB|nr:MULTISPECIES: cell division protein ZapE [Rhodobacter]PTV94193.1 cell division protein ZapE [Rhodobacter aestuarii]SIT13647.1 cell division protein ZapE [Rhodobacter aestuarii]SOC19006.1 cell division protein ZapE [Rhodobacter sp. JA431]